MEGDAETAPSGNNRVDAAEEFAQLRLEVERLRMECDFLKIKAAAFWAKESLLAIASFREKGLDHPIELICRVMAVIESGFYA